MATLKKRASVLKLLDREALMDTTARIDLPLALSVRTGERYSRDLNEPDGQRCRDPWAMAQRSLR